jgi:hypothetical protein
MYGDTPLGVVPYASLLEAGSQYDRDIEIDGTAAVRINTEYFHTLTAAATADFSLTNDNEFFDELQIDASADFARVLNLSTQRTLTISGTGAFSSSALTGYALSRSIDGASNFSGTPYDIHLEGLQIQGTANFTTSAVSGGVLSVIVAGTSAFATSVTGTFNHTRNINWTSALARSVIGTSNLILTVSGTANLVNLPSGSTTSFVTIAGTASFSSPGGVAYFPMLPLDVQSSFTRSVTVGHGLTLSIDGTAETEGDDSLIPGEVIVFAGTAAFTIASELEDFRTLLLACSAAIFVEKFYEFLYEINVLATTDQEYTYNPVQSNNPSASASFSASLTSTINRLIVHQLPFTQSATYIKTTGIASDSFVLTQDAIQERTRNPSVIESLTLTQSAVCFRAVSNTITFSQTLTGPRAFPKTVSQTLSLSHVVGRNIIVGRSLEDTLTYNPPNYYETPITGFQYIRSTVEVRTVSRRCLVIFSVPGQAIVMPCPEFGDTESITGTIDVKRTMSGGTRVYKKQSQLNKLKYTFSLWTNKYLEFRQYFINHSAKIMTMSNWKGELWYGYITNNPIEFDVESRYQPKGEKYSLTLEFEGVKT